MGAEDVYDARERARLEELHGYGVLDTPASAELEAVVRLAADVAGVPTATLNLLDASRQCQLTTVGFDGADSARADSMCDVTVRAGAAVWVPDASLDVRFAANPWVTGRYAAVRFYASVPLLTPAGHVLGTLCVFDTVARTLTQRQLQRLHDCAALVVALFERQRESRSHAHQAVELAEQRDLMALVHATLEERAELLDTVLESVAVGIVVCDAGGHVTHFNRTARGWHGVDADPTLAPSDLPAHYDLFEPDGTTPLTPERVPLLRALVEGQVEGAEFVIVATGHGPRTAVADARRLVASDGTLLGAVVVMEDVTERRRREAALRSSEERFRSAFSQAPTPMAVVDGDGTWVDVNPACCAWLGRSRGELLGRPLAAVLDPDDVAEADEVRRAVLLGERANARVTLRFAHRRGDELWGAVSVGAVTAADGGRQLVCQVEDLSERRAVEERLTAMALHDALTGLANRVLLVERLGHALAVAARDGSTHALLFCDLDRFKHVNDTHGHTVGDEVLVTVAERLHGAVRPSDTVARLGGDEFVVLCEGLAPAEVPVVADRLRAAVRAPIATSAGLVEVGMSIGVAHPSGGSAPEDASVVLARADREMYRSKREGVVPSARQETVLSR
ncbi:sensor domain-containing diguanylate cyclase [Aquipuribacter sp. SD81]|uniref:sensor domain-containing diguanylate cyclase n=1 Tax=Aquipuribacter sp. SD81 TaxID=3127703 RepID=UPI003016E6B3